MPHTLLFSDLHGIVPAANARTILHCYSAITLTNHIEE